MSIATSDSKPKSYGVSRVGIWHLDTESRRFTCCRITKELFGLPSVSGAISFDSVIGLLEIEDREALLAFAANPVDREFSRIVSFQSQTGANRQIEIRAQHLGGNHLSGAAVDISFEEQRRFHAAMLKAVGQSVIATDLEGKVIFWGDGAEKLFGWTAQEALGANVIALTATEMSLPEAESVMFQLSRGKSWTGEFLARKKSGESIWVEVTDSPILGESGQLIGIVGVSIDVTERRNAQNALQMSELHARRVSQELQFVYDRAPIGLCVLSPDLRFLRINKLLAEMNGPPAEEHIGRTVREILPQLADTAEPILRKVVETGEPLLNMELSGETPANPGVIRTWTEHWYPLKDEAGRVIALNVVTEEVTEKIAVERALRESEERYRSIVTTAAAGVIQVTKERFVWVNQRVCEMLGRTEAELLQLSMPDVTHPDDLEEELRLIERTKPGDRYVIDKRFLRPDGSTMWARVSVGVMNPQQDKPLTAVALIFDITDQKTAEQRLALAQQIGHIGVFDWDIASGKVVLAGEMEQILGMEPGTFDGTHEGWRRLLAPEDLPCMEELFEQWFNSQDEKRNYQYRMITPAGEERWIDAQAMIIRDEHHRPLRMLGVNIDITERRRNEEELRLSETRFKMALRSSTIVVFNQDRNLRYTWFYYDHPGFSPESMIGKTDYEVFADEPENAERLMAVKTDVLRTGKATRQLVKLREAGKDQYYELNVEPRFDSLGTVDSIVCCAVRITERVAMEAKLRRSNEDLEQFAYSASHDLQEPLRGMALYSQLLSHKYGHVLDEQGRTFLSTIERSSKRMSDLLRDLLTYSRIVQSEAEVTTAVDTNAMVEQCIVDLRTAIDGCGAQITHDWLPAVLLEPAHLSQLLLNLIGNAVKYIKPGVQPKVHISARPAGSQWIFSVADNGIGIDPRYHDLVFGLFKRLHARDDYSGTGIGLAICKKIIDRYKGQIWVESNEGAGATFRFTLPVATASQATIGE